MNIQEKEYLDVDFKEYWQNTNILYQEQKFKWYTLILMFQLELEI